MADYIPWTRRPGWDDLTPVPQADAPDALVPIAYSTEYSDAMSTFRALVQLPPAPRALDLTEALIRLNPGHYSIWAYRLSVLRAPTLALPLAPELDLLDNLVAAHLKSYQVWQHRKEVVLALRDPSRELAFTRTALALDEKNYHTWAYRQFILLHFYPPSPSPSTDTTTTTTTTTTSETTTSDTNSDQTSEHAHAHIWRAELAYVDDLLARDIRNNSAWNHRYFCLFAARALPPDPDPDAELEYVKAKLLVSPNNPSAWNYLRGILKTLAIPLAALAPFAHALTLPPSPASPSASPDLPAPLAIEFYADAVAVADPATARECWRTLEEMDPIRKGYWKYLSARAVVTAN